MEIYPLVKNPGLRTSDQLYRVVWRTSGESVEEDLPWEDLRAKILWGRSPESPSTRPLVDGEPLFVHEISREHGEFSKSVARFLYASDDFSSGKSWEAIKDAQRAWDLAGFDELVTYRSTPEGK